LTVLTFGCPTYDICIVQLIFVPWDWHHNSALQNCGLRKGMGNTWHTCRTWHASTSTWHVSEASEKKSSPLQ